MGTSRASDPARSTRPSAQLRGLRGTAFGILAMLIIQYASGMWVNLYARLPTGACAHCLAAAYARAVAGGPVALAVHALLGLALLAAGVRLVVHAVRAGRPTPVVAAAVIGLAALLLAALAGTAFVARDAAAASMAMAMATAVAMFSYLLILFTSTAAA